jgi:hypothetical protein
LSTASTQARSFTRNGPIQATPSDNRSGGLRIAQPSLLAGVLFDGECNRMIPSHAVKNGTRYRYYVSRPLITKDRPDRSGGLRIPAGEIERIAASRVRQWLLNPGSIYQTTSAWLRDPSTQQGLITQAAAIGRQWSELLPARTRAVLTVLIERVEVRVNQIDIHLRSPRLPALFDAAVTPSVSEETVILPVPAQLRRAGTEISRMLIDGTDPFAAVKPDSRFDQAAHQGTSVQHAERRRPLRCVCCRRRSEPILFHSGCPPQLSRPGHHPSDSRRSPAARSNGREAARALPSAACLALSPDVLGFV